MVNVIGSVTCSLNIVFYHHHQQQQQQNVVRNVTTSVTSHQQHSGSALTTVTLKLTLCRYVVQSESRVPHCSGRLAHVWENKHTSVLTAAFGTATNVFSKDILSVGCRDTRKNECEVSVEWQWQGQEELLVEELANLPLCPAQIIHGRLVSWRRMMKVNNRLLIAWLMVRRSRLSSL